MTYYSAQALRLLSRSPLLHMDMLQSMERGHAEILDVTDRRVLLHDLPSGCLMLSAADEESARRAILAAPRTHLFTVHQPYYLDAIQVEFRLPQRTVCHQAVYCPKKPLPLPVGADIRPLDHSFLPFLAAHYDTVGGAGYLRDRVEEGVVWGAFVEEEPAGFIGLHPEGSIGMLEVLPAFRRRGIASALESFLVNRLLARGYTPFAQIVEGNEPSLRLHRRLGFSIAEETLCCLTADQP